VDNGNDNNAVPPNQSNSEKLVDVNHHSPSESSCNQKPKVVIIDSDREDDRPSDTACSRPYILSPSLNQKPTTVICVIDSNSEDDHCTDDRGYLVVTAPFGIQDSGIGGELEVEHGGDNLMDVYLDSEDEELFKSVTGSYFNF
jgi:hypothetical protein